MMATKAQIIQMLDLVPDIDLPTLLDIIRHYVPVTSADDLATPDDLASHEEAMAELAAGDVVAFEDIDWD